MLIKFNIKPQRDTYNSYPEDIEFTCDNEGVTVYLGDITLVFNKEDFNKMFKIIEMDK